MTYFVLTVISLSMMTASIAFTISESALFRPLRERAARLGKLPGKLIGCGYCLTHWIGVGLVSLFLPRLWTHPKEFVLTTFTVIWLACLQWGAMASLMRISGK